MHAHLLDDGTALFASERNVTVEIQIFIETMRKFCLIARTGSEVKESKTKVVLFLVLLPSDDGDATT